MAKGKNKQSNRAQRREAQRSAKSEGSSPATPIQTTQPAKAVQPPNTPVAAPVPPKPAPAAPPTAEKKVAAPPAIPAKAITPAKSETNSNVGTIVSCIKSSSGSPQFGKLKTESDEILILHYKSSPKIPPVGTIVQYEQYEHEGRKAARVVKELGKNEKYVARMREIAQQGTYAVIDPANLLDDDALNPSVIGVTETGHVIFHIK